MFPKASGRAELAAVPPVPPHQKPKFSRNRHPCGERPGAQRPEPQGRCRTVCTPHPTPSSHWGDPGPHSPCQTGSRKGWVKTWRCFSPAVSLCPQAEGQTHDHFKGRFVQQGTRCTSSRELGWVRYGGFKPCPSITEQHFLPLDPAHHGQGPYAPGCHIPQRVSPCPSLHPPIPARAFVIPKQVTPSNISLWQCRLGPTQTTIGHLGTPKDDHTTSLPATDWTKDAFFPTLNKTTDQWWMAHGSSPVLTQE